LTRAEVGDPSSPLLFNRLSAAAKSPHHLKEGPPIPTLPEVTIGIEGAPPPVRGLSGYSYRRAPRYCEKSQGEARRRTRHSAHRRCRVREKTMVEGQKLVERAIDQRSCASRGPPITGLSGTGNYSGFAPEKLTTLPHFSISSAMSLPKLAGEPGSGAPPTSAMRALIRGSAKAATIPLFSDDQLRLGNLACFGKAHHRHEKRAPVTIKLAGCRPTRWVAGYRLNT